MTNHKPANIKQDAILNSLFFLFVLVIFFTRLVFFFRYNLDLIDSDQPFMWVGARDYSNGHFYEPRYYAQDYNTFMEALFAVPLLWLKIPVYYAVPLATHLISLFPFLFMAFYLFRKEKKVHALIVLAVIMCMPAPYDLLNALPRGFVTGLFFTSFFIVNILNPNALVFICVNTLLSALAYFVNPNSVVVSGPFLFYLFLHHYKNPKYYVASIPGALILWPLHLLFNKVYIDHPEYAHNKIEYVMGLEFFQTNINNLDRAFAHISFFVADNCLLLLLVLVVFGTFLFLRNKKAFSALLLMIAVLLFSFFVRKTLEGSTWVYSSLSRMYLGIPIFICLFLPVISIPWRKFLWILFLIPPSFSIYKVSTLEKTMARHFEIKNWSGVHLVKLDYALHAMDVFKRITKEHDANFMLVSNGYWLNTFLTYGGPAVDEEYPATLETRMEKRHWISEKYNDVVIEKFILLAWRNDLEKRFEPTDKFQFKKLDDYGLTFVSNNKLAMGEFIKQLNVAEFRELDEP